MIKYFLTLLTFVAIAINAPAQQKNHTTISLPPEPQWYQTMNADYQPEATHYFDLIHTDLELSFDWQKEYVLGKATHTVSPHFYPQDTLMLDAKGFDIHTVKINGHIAPYQYHYNRLSIVLPRTFTRADTLTVLVDYTAKPSELPAGGSAAITNDIGLYFINPQGNIPNKPQQIWTQGETESSSCWFPTFDKPNYRGTQRIALTVDTVFETLSNGLLTQQTQHPNGTRTDVWEQNLPDAPYLTMIAVGDFAIIKDQWNGMPVHYYVEHAYAQHAGTVFGNTTKMLDFYSQKFGVKYPWAKYHQVVVRDFVSGAMENTGAVVFMDGLNITKQQHIDHSWDDIIAHELSHHWFGNLVTCESWANLPLNESFATYCEYLWFEHNRGRNYADAHRMADFDNYLSEARRKRVPLVRFYYTDKEKMFDNHSYAKGGLILHLLRYEAGDEAFFAALNHYLNQNRNTAVEIHDLRQAFEEVTGKDWNPFFNQWFFERGHPELNIKTRYGNDTLWVAVAQTQTEFYQPVFDLPGKIAVHTQSGITDFSFRIRQRNDTFAIALNQKPQLVVFDPDYVLPAQINQNKTEEQLALQLQKARLGIIRLIAWQEMDKITRLSNISIALNDTFADVRKEALQTLRQTKKSKYNQLKLYDKIEKLVLTDPNPHVRLAATAVLVQFDAESASKVFKQALNDPSPSVQGMALKGLLENKNTDTRKLIESFKNTQNIGIIKTISEYVARTAQPNWSQWYQNNINTAPESALSFLVQDYTIYMSETKTFDPDGIDLLLNTAQNHQNKYVRFAAFNGLTLLINNQPQLLTKLTQIAENEPDSNLRRFFIQMLNRE